MNCIDKILNYLKDQAKYLDQIPLQVNEDSFKRLYADFYGDVAYWIIGNCKNTKTDIATNMRLDSRILSYIFSRNDLKHRNIKFYEALCFCVVTNLSIEDSIAFLNVANYSLCYRRLRDRIIYIVLRTCHHSKLEMDARLDCLSALEDNEPWNTDDYDYFTLISYVRRKREGL